MARSKITKRRATADKVLAQGTGRVAAKPFGATRMKKVKVKAKRTTIPRPMGLPSGAWDAFCSMHAPLPRSVGPYTVVRTTRMFTSDCPFLMFGTFRKEVAGTTCWSSIISAGANAGGSPAYSSLPIKDPNTTDFHSIIGPGGQTASTKSTFTCCPAAISVQVMGQESLQDASGQFAAAVVPARLDLYAENRSWDTVIAEFVTFMRPRLMSGGKLALRGVQMDSMPLSMNDVSDFLPLHQETQDYSASQWSSSLNFRPTGWAPMCVFNDQKKPVTYLVSVEWRVRFDISNPAVASHTHHGVTTDHQWDQHIKRASAALPGVCDIVERVANTGLNIYKASQAAGLLA